MTSTLVVTFLVVIALAYVAAPLRRGSRADAGDDRTDELEARKHAALLAILDLEAERDVGKLTDEDLKDLRASYESEALAALAELDAAGEAPDALEREIAAVRRRLQRPD
ncbi:MAG TPA: hypothetical protein VG929_11535 [Actinomycetota bacterium]|nr:hypothetical protein [Actinomycetota bacterium]